MTAAPDTVIPVTTPITPREVLEALTPSLEEPAPKDAGPDKEPSIIQKALDAKYIEQPLDELAAEIDQFLNIGSAARDLAKMFRHDAVLATCHKDRLGEVMADLVDELGGFQGMINERIQEIRKRSYSQERKLRFHDLLCQAAKEEWAKSARKAAS